VKRYPLQDYLDYCDGVGAPDWVWAYIEACSCNGGVFHAGPDMCMVARPVVSSIPVDMLNELADISPTHPRHEEFQGLTEAPDAWHILYASGDIRRFFELDTLNLPKVIWQRDGQGDGKIYDFQTIKSRVLRQAKNTSRSRCT